MAMDKDTFLQRVKDAKAGEIITYHLGSLMRDRVVGPDFPTVHCTAHVAWEAMERGEVHLTQALVRRGVFEYRAVKRFPPFKPIEFWGCCAVEKKKHQKPSVRDQAVAPAVERGRTTRRTRTSAPVDA